MALSNTTVDVLADNFRKISALADSLRKREWESGIVPESRLKKISIGAGMSEEDARTGLVSIKLKLRGPSGSTYVGTPRLSNINYISAIDVLRNHLGEHGVTLAALAAAKTMSSSRKVPIDKLTFFKSADLLITCRHGSRPSSQKTCLMRWPGKS